MAVTAYGLNMDASRRAALGVQAVPNYLPRPNLEAPLVFLYSDLLNEWSENYVDNGSLTSAAWAADPLLAKDTAAANSDTLLAQMRAAVTANQTYLGLASPTNAQVVAQVRLLTREATGLIRLAANLLDSTAGT